MHLIKLDATASTNEYLKLLLQEKALKDLTVVMCRHQTNGRGQQGNHWLSYKDKNLTVSVLKRPVGVKVSEVYFLNCLVSLAIYRVLNELSVPDVKVKWPNDIMSGNKKICGILIENMLKGASVKAAILGFGLNVNQTKFPDLPAASSLKLIMGRDYNLETLLSQIVQSIDAYFKMFLDKGFLAVKQEYEEVLFRKEESSKFLLPDGTIFHGCIKGITDGGQLRIKKEDGQIRTFAFKEVRLLY